MKKTILAVCVSVGFVLTSCNGKKSKEAVNAENGKQDSTAHSGEHIYACPMHPEVTGKAGDKCPKCGMALEHNDNAGKANGLTYFMDYKCTAQSIKAGEGCFLSFTPRIKGKEDEQVPLSIVHEKKLHLIIVSKDLRYFEHIHPEYQADGSYQIKVLKKDEPYSISKGRNETYFIEGGDYMMFADYAPSGGVHQMEKIPVSVSGSPYKNTSYTKERLTSSVDGFEVTLDTEGEKWLANQPMHIKALVKKDGKLVDAGQFENYLGAKSHMVVLRTETFDYLHVHPEVENGNLDLHTTFEKPGIYRGWLQFQTDGKVHAADFVINVGQANGDMNSESHSGHSH